MQFRSRMCIARRTRRSFRRRNSNRKFDTMWLLAVTVENGLFLAGMALVILVLLRRSTKLLTKSPRDTKRPVAPRCDAKSVKNFDAPPEILQYQVQLHDTARELTAR